MAEKDDKRSDVYTVRVTEGVSRCIERRIEERQRSAEAGRRVTATDVVRAALLEGLGCDDE